MYRTLNVSGKRLFECQKSRKMHISGPDIRHDSAHIIRMLLIRTSDLTQYHTTDSTTPCIRLLIAVPKNTDKMLKYGKGITISGTIALARAIYCLSLQFVAYGCGIYFRWVNKIVLLGTFWIVSWQAKVIVMGQFEFTGTETSISTELDLRT